MGRPTPDRSLRAAALAGLAVALLAAPALAATSRLAIGLNQSLRVPLGGYASSVVVANPSIADVTMVDAHSAVIIGKTKGSSEVMVLDAAGRTLLDTIVMVTPTGDRPGLENQITLFLGSTPHEYVCAGRCSSDGKDGEKDSPVDTTLKAVNGGPGSD